MAETLNVDLHERRRARRMRDPEYRQRMSASLVRSPRRTR